jgi:hypothetical protein
MHPQLHICAPISYLFLKIYSKDVTNGFVSEVGGEGIPRVGVENGEFDPLPMENRSVG